MNTHNNKRLLLILGFSTIIYFGVGKFVATSFAQPPISQKNNIAIEITTHLGDKQAYFEGDMLEFLVNISQSAYVMLIYEDASRQIVQVLPNQFTPNLYLTAGIYRKIPEDNAPYTFTITPPFGDERLWAFAAEKPFPEIDGKWLDNGLKVLAHNLAEINTLITQHYKNQNLPVSKTSLSIQTYKSPNN